MNMPKILYLASDHAGFSLKEQLKEILTSSASEDLIFKNLQIVDLSLAYTKDDDYPLVAKKLADIIFENSEALGIAICGSGQGICMALNRYKKVRAGLAHSKKEATLLRQHNHAQILCLSGFSYSIKKEVGILKAFLQAKPSQEERHLRRVQQLDNLTS